MRWPRYARPTVSLPAEVKAIKLPLGRTHAAPPGHDRNQTMSNPDRPFGWRKRIGLLSPTVIETDRLAPDGVSMCATTSNIEHWSRENFKQHVLDPIVTAVRYLASRHVDYIIHTGMPVVTTRGKGFEDELVKQIEDATGLPATTSIRSAIRALAHLGIRNVAVVTPYPQELHKSALSFLGASGFRVIAEHTMDVVFKRLQDVTPAQIFATAKRVLASAPSTDGVYIPCNQWSGADAAPLIESELGIPVVTGAHADYWEAFRSLGINDRIEGHGRLMLSLSEMAPAPMTAAARG
jgi:maleate isomerase